MDNHRLRALGQRLETKLSVGVDTLIYFLSQNCIGVFLKRRENNGLVFRILLQGWKKSTRGKGEEVTYSS